MASSTGGTDAERKRAWCPRDTFAWLQDGTSNQILIGEKHVPQSVLGKCDPNGTTGGNTYTDCGIQSVAQNRGTPAGRAFCFSFSVNESSITNPFPLARPNDHDGLGGGDRPLRHYGFGSYHPGICNFVLGDGSVRAISVTTPIDPVLFRLGVVDDGESVALP